MAETTDWQTLDRAAAAADHGEDRVMDPATTEGDTHASGNPGANSPGVGSMMSGEAGVTTDTDIARGWNQQGDVGSGVTSAMGTGGIGSTGVIGGPTPHLPADTGITGPGANEYPAAGAKVSGVSSESSQPGADTGNIVSTSGLDSDIGGTGGVGASNAGTEGISSGVGPATGRS